MLNVNDLFCPFQIIHIQLKSGKKPTDDECGTTETTKWIKAVREISEEQEEKKMKNMGMREATKKTQQSSLKAVKEDFFFSGFETT